MKKEDSFSSSLLLQPIDLPDMLLQAGVRRGQVSSKIAGGQVGCLQQRGELAEIAGPLLLVENLARIQFSGFKAQ